MPCKINIELECAVPSCNFGRHSTKYKTQHLPQQYALQLMRMHRADAHGLEEAEVAKDHDVQVDAVPETVCTPVPLRGCNVGEPQSFQVDKDTEVEVEDTPVMVCRPVLPRGCSVEQFKSFHMAWSSYAEEFRSQFEETYREVDEVRLKYLLNYELLSSIPTSMEHAIYRARAFMVDRVPTATLLLDIKRITVGEAVKRAQQAVVRNIDEVTEAGVETVIDEVAKDNTGGQGGAPLKKIPSLTLTVGSLARNSWGAGSRWTTSRGRYSTTGQSCLVEMGAREGAPILKFPSLTFHVVGSAKILRLR